MPSPLTNWPRLDLTRLIALVLESFFNGIFWTLFYRCNKVLYHRSLARNERIIRPINLAGWILFCLILSHLIVEIYAASLAFIPSPNSICIQLPKGLTYADVFYLELDHPTNVLYSGLYVATTVAADSFLIYRLYVVWNGNIWVTVVPAALCIGLLVTGSVVTYLFKHARQSIFGIARRWILSCYVLTFLCNFYSTSMLAYKLSLAERFVQDVLITSVFHKIFEIVIQSAAIYCLLVILSLTFISVSSNLSFITVAITIPTIGIIFSLIVTRTHDHLALQRPEEQSADIEFNFNPRPNSQPSRPQRVNKRSRGESLESHISRPNTLRTTTTLTPGAERDTWSTQSPTQSPTTLCSPDPRVSV